jgi:hypothetical protein
MKSNILKTIAIFIAIFIGNFILVYVWWDVLGPLVYIGSLLLGWYAGDALCEIWGLKHNR